MSKYISYAIVLTVILFTSSSVLAVGAFPVATGGTGQVTFTSSQLLYGNGTKALSSIATTTLSGSGVVSVTAGAVTLGSSPITISCVTCGTGSVTSIATAWPITGGTITTTGTLGFNGLSTSTAAVVGNIPYFSGVNIFANVATTTHSFSGPFTITGTIGTLVGGTNSTVTWTGLATTSQPVSGNLLVSNGNTGVYGVGTTTFTGNNGLTLSAGAGAFVGGSNATIGLAAINANSVLGNSSGSSAVPSSLATSSLFQNASAANTGLLTSTDWSTFNGKGSGTVTSIATGNGLTGGTITTTGTLSTNTYTLFSTTVSSTTVQTSTTTMQSVTIPANTINGTTSTLRVTSLWAGDGTGLCFSGLSFGSGTATSTVGFGATAFSSNMINSMVATSTSAEGWSSISTNLGSPGKFILSNVNNNTGVYMGNAFTITNLTAKTYLAFTANASVTSLCKFNGATVEVVSQ